MRVDARRSELTRGAVCSCEPSLAPPVPWCLRFCVLLSCCHVDAAALKSSVPVLKQHRAGAPIWGRAQIPPCYRFSRVFRACSGVGCECYFDCADDDCVVCWLNVGHEVQRPGRGVTKDEMQPCNRVVVAESSMVVSWMSPLDDRGFPPLGNWKRQSGSRSTRHSSHSRERNI